MSKNQALTFDDINIIPKYSEIFHRADCSVKTQFSKNYKINIPIVSSPMDTVTEYNMAYKLMNLGGVGVLHRFMSINKQTKIVKDLRKNKKKYNKGVISAAIGVTGDYLERAQELIHSGCDVLLIDVAHGDHILVKRAISKLKNISGNFDIIAGSIATKNSAENLCYWGVDGIRVGIGGGSMCSTRMQTGVGIPQVTAILDCVSVAENYGVPVIADGGIRFVGDVAKAIGLGSSTVMLGSLLSGTKESPGKISKQGTWPNEKLYKKYRGSASLEAKLSREENGKNVEGESTLVQYKGKINRIISDILDGLRSSMSYTNSRTILDFHANFNFVKVTSSGITEAKPHGIIM